MAALRLFLVLVLLGVTYGAETLFPEKTVTKLNEAAVTLDCKYDGLAYTKVVWSFTAVGGEKKVICTDDTKTNECVTKEKHIMVGELGKATGLKITTIADTDAGTYECVTSPTADPKEDETRTGELAVAPNVTCTPNKATVGKEAKIVCEFNVNGKKDAFKSTLDTVVKYESAEQKCSEAKNADDDQNHQANTVCVKVEELKVTSTATFDDPIKTNPLDLTFVYTSKLAIKSGAPAVPVSWLLLVVCALLVTKL